MFTLTIELCDNSEHDIFGLEALDRRRKCALSDRSQMIARRSTVSFNLTEGEARRFATWYQRVIEHTIVVTLEDLEKIGDLEEETDDGSIRVGLCDNFTKERAMEIASKRYAEMT